MISIVIPTYNAERFITPLLESVFRNKIEEMEVVRSGQPENIL